MAASTTSVPPQRGRFDWPWRGGPSFVTPDGSQVSLGGAALDTTRPWSALFAALVHGTRRAFTVAEAGAFDWHSTYTMIPDEIRRYPYRGGELLLGTRHPQTGDEPGDYRAAWRGQWFELHTCGSGAAPAADRLIRIFDAFRLTDTPLGMLAAPRSVRQARMEPFQVAKQIPGLGFLTIERPEHGRIGVPDFRGHPTEHGELWREPLGIGAHGRARPDALLLATPTAVTRLVAGPSDSADPNEVLALLAGLNVIWEPA
ncbi:MAG TPA: hypothetical protein VHH34_02765 [Pseudonocardiaceae bacterium]|nr:hypothetical protein [Pseudonocardiaceae bacterium]